ncbi:MAG: hypothetical protein ACK57R_12035 [Dolichospermum sp.]|jgi:hypothetical protein|nr:hypothetical protein [Anabaena sp. 49628_E55]
MIYTNTFESPMSPQKFVAPVLNVKRKRCAPQESLVGWMDKVRFSQPVFTNK